MKQTRVRENKYRAWDGNKFHYYTSLSGLYGVLNPIEQQYTGLKDKNGIDIYEGDWLQSAPGYTSVIEFKEGAFMSIYTHPEDGEDLHITDLNLSKAEIIGNIYNY